MVHRLLYAACVVGLAAVFIPAALLWQDAGNQLAEWMAYHRERM